MIPKRCTLHTPCHAARRPPTRRIGARAETLGVPLPVARRPSRAPNRRRCVPAIRRPLPTARSRVVARCSAPSGPVAARSSAANPEEVGRSLYLLGKHKAAIDVYEEAQRLGPAPPRPARRSSARPRAHREYSSTPSPALPARPPLPPSARCVGVCAIDPRRHVMFLWWAPMRSEVSASLRTFPH